MSRSIDAGYLPLLDAAPLVIAAEIGFAAEEGIDLALHRETSWAALRDRLIWGQYRAAHMLAPVVVAQAAGLGAGDTALDALMVLSVNGNTIGVSPALAAAMGAGSLDFLDAATTGRALLAAAGGRLRFGVPFPFSMHAELVSYWLGGLGGGDVFELATIPPPRMARAVASGEIDAFCVGEPWGSVAIERGAAELVLPGAAIWRFAPEKVLAMTRATVERAPDEAAALMRACWRAAQWAAEPSNAMTAAEIMGRYLDVPAEIVERPLRGRLVINSRGDERRVPRCIEFFAGAATFPWRSQALWIADAIARRTGADRSALRAAARAAFRSDLYRDVLGPAGADLPGASEKLEGALPVRTAVASTLGRLQLGPDSFFDGRVFDPSLSD
jgi:NitT/TauT family transport system ATP-binding protein